MHASYICIYYRTYSDDRFIFNGHWYRQGLFNLLFIAMRNEERRKLNEEKY